MRFGMLIFAFAFVTPCFSQNQSSPIVSMPLNSFKMPSNVLEVFQRDGCTVAQSSLSSRPHNVAHGEFAAPGQEDWMIACKLQDGSVQARFVWGGEHRCEGPLANDMVMHLAVNDLEFLIAPYLTTAPPRNGQTHQRILQRWSPTGIWSYYCNDGRWEKTPGDSCTKTSQEIPRTLEQLSDSELKKRRDPKDVAAAELADAFAKLASPQELKVTGANADCRPAGSLRQICYFQMANEDSLNANVVVERVGKEAWFATKVEGMMCHLM